MSGKDEFKKNYDAAQNLRVAASKLYSPNLEERMQARSIIGKTAEDLDTPAPDYSNESATYQFTVESSNVLTNSANLEVKNNLEGLLDDEKKAAKIVYDVRPYDDGNEERLKAHKDVKKYQELLEKSEGRKNYDQIVKDVKGIVEKRIEKKLSSDNPRFRNLSDEVRARYKKYVLSLFDKPEYGLGLIQELYGTAVEKFNKTFEDEGDKAKYVTLSIRKLTESSKEEDLQEASELVRAAA